MPTFEELKALLQPSEQDKRQAIAQGLLGLGAGILGSRGSYGALGPALGQGLQQGLQGYNQALATGKADRMQNLQNMMLLDKIMKQQAADDLAKSISGKFINGEYVTANISPAPYDSNNIVNINGGGYYKDLTYPEKQKLLAQLSIVNPETAKTLSDLYLTPEIKNQISQGINPSEVGPISMAERVNKAGGMQYTNGMMQEVPGYSSTTSDIAGQTQRAKELNTVRDITTSSGAVVPMLTSQAISGNLPQQTQPSKNQPFANLYQNQPQIGQSTLNKEFGQEMGKTYAKNYSNILAAGQDANNKLNRLDRIEQLLKDVETGKLTPLGTEIARYATSVGIPVDQKLGNKQAAISLTNEIALSLRNPAGGAGMPGAMSDKDREFLQSMPPNIANTPEGNKLIMESMRKLAKRDQEVATLATQYRKAHGVLDDGFTEVLQKFSNEHPLFQNVQPAINLPFSRDAIQNEINRRTSGGG